MDKILKRNHLNGLKYSLDDRWSSELDVGFVPFNQASYSDLVPLFDEVGVEVESCDMSVGVSITENKKFEWSSAGFRGLFAQKRNMLNPYFWNMIREILKFNTDVQRYLQKVESNDASINLDETLGKFLDSYGYSKKFKEDYMFPIRGSIWSCPSDMLCGLSAASVLTFLSDHKLLQLLPGRSQWLSIRGGPQTYVEKVMEDLKTAGTKIKTSALVTQITILERGRVQLEDDKGGLDVFDECVVAANAPDALQMRAEAATLSEKNFLGAVKYLNCDIYMHRDTAFMPKNRAVWSALNVQDDACGGSFATYWLNPVQDRITFKICDYRVLPGHRKFDRIIGCELYEHLGHNYQKVFFDRCDYLLAKHGLVVFQSSSCPDDVYDSHRRSGGFMKEIFHGANMPCLSVLASSSASKFSVEQVENIGPHYYQTLMCWQENLLANSSEIKRLGFDDKFIRRMVYYFSFCAAGYRSCVIGCIQVVLSRPGNTLTLGDPAICFPAVWATMKKPVSNED
ncbi:unnamed protein product [Calypogeia fissa]